MYCLLAFMREHFYFFFFFLSVFIYLPVFVYVNEEIGLKQSLCRSLKVPFLFLLSWHLNDCFGALKPEMDRFGIAMV